MSEEVPVTSNITFTNPDGTPFTPHITTTQAYANTNATYVPPGGWNTNSEAWRYGVTAPTQTYDNAWSNPISGTVYANISPADIERIADAVLAKIEQKSRTRKG